MKVFSILLSLDFAFLSFISAMDEPPEKKKRNVEAKPGRAREYLGNNYSALPENAADVLNGHILFIYMNNGSSPTNTDRSLLAKFPEVVSAKRMIRNLVEKSVKKFRHLTNDVEFAKFKAICEARFCIPCQRHDGSNVPAETPTPSATVDTTSIGQDSLITGVPSVNEDGDGAVVGSSASEPRAGSSSSSMSSALSQCPSCVKLRQRLKDSIKHRAEMRKKDMALIDSYRSKLKASRQSHNIRIHNQKMRRKNERIQTLVKEKQNFETIQILQARKELRNTKKKLWRLKKRNP